MSKHAPEMLAMLKRILEEVQDLDWTGAGCCPFCDPGDWSVPYDMDSCELKVLIAKVEAE